jgi:hypothetical protein
MKLLLITILVSIAMCSHILLQIQAYRSFDRSCENYSHSSSLDSWQTISKKCSLDLQHFQHIQTVGSSILSTLVEEVNRQEDGFYWSNRREMLYPAVQDTQTISLRSVDVNEMIIKDVKATDVLRTSNTSHVGFFGQIMNFLEQFASNRESVLEGVNISRLKPNGSVYSHRDEGRYYRQKDRFHLVLMSAEGSELWCGDSRPEAVVMKEGDIWWLDNKQLHSAHNPSKQWRVHVIFDLSPTKDTGFVQKKYHYL